MVFKFFKGCFPQTLFGPLLNTFSQLTIVTKLSNLDVYEGSGEAFTYCISSSKSMYQMHTFTFLEEFVIKLHKKNEVFYQSRTLTFQKTFVLFASLKAL